MVKRAINNYLLARFFEHVFDKLVLVITLLGKASLDRVHLALQLLALDPQLLVFPLCERGGGGGGKKKKKKKKKVKKKKMGVFFLGGGFLWFFFFFWEKKKNNNNNKRE